MISQLRTFVFLSTAGLVSCATDPTMVFDNRVTFSYTSPEQAVEMIDTQYGAYENYQRGFGSPKLCNKYYQAGRYATARSCYQDYVKLWSDYDLFESRALWADRVGGAYGVQGDPGKYKKYSSEFLAKGYFNLALINLDFGQYNDVISQVETARKFLRSSEYKSDVVVSGIIRTPLASRAYSAAAVAAMQTGNKKQAEMYADLCVRVKLERRMAEDLEGSPETRAQAAACGTALVAIGDYTKASQWLSADVGGVGMRLLGAFISFGVSEMAGMGKQSTDPFDANFIFLKARICEIQGDLDCAKKGYDILLSNEQQNIQVGWIDKALLSNRPNLFYQVLYRRAEVALQQDERDMALSLLKQAVEVIESLRSSINTETARIGFAGDKQAVYARLVEQLIVTGRVDEAFGYVERGKARALVDLLASKQQLGTAKQSVEVKNLLAQTEQSEGKLLAAVNGTQDFQRSTRNAQQSNQRSTSRALIKSRLSQLKTTQPELASLVTVSAPQLAQLQQRLPVNETLLEYYGHDDQLYIFVLTRKGVGAVKLDGNGLQESVNRFRSALSQPDTLSYRNEARHLYARLIAPVEQQLTTHNVTIVPHASLHYLPFAALGNGQEYLIDRYAIRVLPSASVLSFLGKTHQAKNSLLAVGNPDLKDAALDLPGAQIEATAIARGQSGAQLLLRQQATETAVKQHGGNYKYLHFASHGMFDPDKPLESGLLLAADKENDGTLTVGELYNLNLNADLVTLSACETALGKIANGDDVVGFTRGFLYAGANSIVSSLWKVDDKATSELMQNFYQTMGTKNKREALRLAQLQLKQKQSHPYYWAAFQLTGSVN